MSETNYDARIVVGGTSSPYTLTDGKTYTAESYAGDGGVLYVKSDGSVTGTNITFSGNTVSEYGGAIYNCGGTISLNGATFSGNTAGGNGGAIYNDGGTISLASATFSGSKANHSGGAIYNAEDGTLTVSGDAVFSQNVSGGTMFNGGGAVYNSGTFTVITSATFSSNTAGKYGGAIRNSGAISLTSATFRNNKVDSYGGAVYNSGTFTVIGDASFSSNTAGKYGGAIRNSGTIDDWGTVSLTSATFSGNTSGGSGGAICNDGTLTISGDATFSNNTAGSTGGAICNAEGGTASLFSATFSGNTAGSYGGAICNAGTVNLTGNVVLSTSSDSVAWDITGGTSSYATISGYSYLLNNGNAELTILVKDEQECGEYTIASGVESDLADNKKTFTLRENAGSTSASITVDAGSVAYSSRSYSLSKVDDNLVLSIGVLSEHDLTGDANIQPMYAGSGAIFSVCGNTVTRAKLGDTVTLSALPVDQFEVAGYTSDDVTISGGSFTMPDKAVTVKAQYRFNVQNGKTLNLVSGTYTNELGYSGDGGMGEVQEGGTLTADGMVTFTGNTACTDGGAVYNSGTVMVSGDAVFSQNVAGGTGGAIWNSGTVSLTSATFTGNTAGKSGGAVYNAGTITVSGEASFSNNMADYYSGGALYNDAGTLTVIGEASFRNNMADYYGGAIENFRGMVTLASATFSGNTARNGGALYNYYGTVSFTASAAAFIGNTSGSLGGAIDNSGGTISFTGSTTTVTFTGNTSGGNGGALSNSGTISLTAASFNDNTSGKYGGAIRNSGTISLTSATFINNTASSYGGAVYNSGTLTVSSTATFSNNTSDHSGGAIHNDGGTVSLASATFSNNTAGQWSGGAIRNDDGTLTVSDAASFSNNMAGKYGGTIYNDGGTISLASATFSGSTANHSGGAIYNDDGTLTVSGAAVFSQNVSGGTVFNGGGAISNRGTVSLASATFSGNTAGKYGGAIYNSGTVSLTSATFSGNTSGSNGGAICNYGDMVKITGNAVFSQNVAGGTGGIGGAIYNASTISLASATFSGNTATDTKSGAIYNDGTINLTGTIELASATDTVYNAGTINWDLAGDAATTVSGFQYIDNAGTLTITVSSEMAETASYVIATGDFTGTYATGFTLTGATGTASISVDGGTVEYNDRCYTLSVTDSAMTLTSTAISSEHPVNSDIDGNGISDVVFQYTGGNYQIGFWMNGTNTWQGQGIGQPSEWELIGAYDMDQNGKADLVMRGNIEIESTKGAYIGYYKDGDVTQWQNISYLNNSDDIDWKLAIGNVTGNTNCNSIVWHSPELGALGVWTDGTANWVSLSGGFDSNWTMLGCGDFDGNGKDEILFSNAGNLYTTDIDQNFASLGNASGWEVCAIGDFSGDAHDDIILFHNETGVVMKYENGQASQWSSLGQLDAQDWFIVGAGDYNGDQEDDLLVRQYSTGMLGYYESGNMSKWVEMGRGVDMDWSVIA